MDAAGSGSRLLALGGVVGPVTFVGTWLVAGIVKTGSATLKASYAGVNKNVTVMVDRKIK